MYDEYTEMIDDVDATLNKCKKYLKEITNYETGELEQLFDGQSLKQVRQKHVENKKKDKKRKKIERKRKRDEDEEKHIIEKEDKEPTQPPPKKQRSESVIVNDKEEQDDEEEQDDNDDDDLLVLEPIDETVKSMLNDSNS